MNFLEAHRIVSSFEGGEPLPFLFAMSGTPDSFLLYLRACAAQQGRSADVQTLPFNTLGQHLVSDGAQGPAVYLILPWDLVPEADWRSGIPAQAPDEQTVKTSAASFADRLLRRRSRVLYLPAPLPPIWSDGLRVAGIERWLESIMVAGGATVLPSGTFSLSTFLATGCPVAGSGLSVVARAAIDALVAPPKEAAKVLVTDLDNTLWSGIVGDDGPSGIKYRPEGKGFPHFLYQTLLKRLRAEGVLLAAVSKNDPDVALAPFQRGGMVLDEADFVAVMASWNAKSAQIRELSERLNIGLEAFVFVDDNDIELAEVEGALPTVRRELFPAGVVGLPELFDRLSAVFKRERISEEDRQRTELYRRRLDGMAPSTMEGADLSAFLRDLRMKLTIRDLSSGDRTRAVQLINKTNQFNLNGRRVTDEEIATLLATGGRLFGATLVDRTGSHGEILTCALDARGTITSLVMSCRVFQRRVEFAFLAWLAEQSPPPVSFAFAETDRNGPLRQFLSVVLSSAAPKAGDVPFVASDIGDRFSADRALFLIEDEVAG